MWYCVTERHCVAERLLLSKNFPLISFGINGYQYNAMNPDVLK